MVVEGDAHERAFHAMLLQRFDYRVAVAAAAEDALGMIALDLPALIITELDLPEMSGLDLLARVQQDPRTAGIPVVALAANGDQESEARCRRAGFNACLGMPVGPEELFRTIQAAIEPVTRTSLRIHTKMPVIVNNVPLDCVGGECASVLSENGMYIRTLKPYPPNARLAVQIGVRDASSRLMPSSCTTISAAKAPSASPAWASSSPALLRRTGNSSGTSSTALSLHNPPSRTCLLSRRTLRPEGCDKGRTGTAVGKAERSGR
jgi:CheY-like chemotaxis protein